MVVSLPTEREARFQLSLAVQMNCARSKAAARANASDAQASTTCQHAHVAALDEEVTIPRMLFDSMLAATAAQKAELLLRDIHRGLARGESEPLIHPGDDLGRVVALLWRRDREMTIMFLADYMAELRVHAAEPLPITLNQVLEGLTQFAWPPWASDDEAQELSSAALERVPGYYGSDSTLTDP